MISLCRQAQALGKTLREYLSGEPGPLLAFEFDIWEEFRLHHGFAAERIEGAIVVVGSHLLRAWGSKIEPENLRPTFQPKGRKATAAIEPPQVSNQVIASYLAAHGGKVELTP